MDAPFALDGSVSEEKLLELLQQQTELQWLDYKRECDLSTTEGKVELAKDVGAFSMHSGYLVIGAEDNGQVSGLSAEQVEKFDQASFSAQMAKYLDGVDLRAGRHKVGGHHVALVWVGPHSDGFSVFKAELSPRRWCKSGPSWR